ERDHLERAVVLVALVPGARGEDAYGVRPFADVAKLERLAEVVVSLVGLVVEYDVDVVAHPGRGVFVRLVALEVAGEFELEFDVRARDRRALLRLDYLESR